VRPFSDWQTEICMETPHRRLSYISRSHKTDFRFPRHYRNHFPWKAEGSRGSCRHQMRPFSSNHRRICSPSFIFSREHVPWSAFFLSPRLTRVLIPSDILESIAFTIARDEDEEDEDEEGVAPRTTSSTDSNGTLGFLKKQRWVYMAVYELCSGGDLQSYLDKHPQKVRDVSFIKNLFGSLIAALQCLHDKGVIHGDLKPENILIDKQGNPKLADFGMCQKISNTMVPQGTPSFLSPEVVEAWFTPTPSHHFTDKVDIFSLGAMAMYVITGRYPFKRVTARLRSGVKYSAEELGLLFKLNSKRLKEIGAVSETLAKLISHCLSPEAAKRPSAAVLLQALRG
jgi:serine/threonine protein kinase